MNKENDFERFYRSMMVPLSISSMHQIGLIERNSFCILMNSDKNAL